MPLGTTATSWFHVAPLFLFPRILAAGGLSCGMDLDAIGSPRRLSSRDNDDQELPVLGNRKPSEFVMLFRSANPPLLDEKLRGHRVKDRPWNAYPHVRFEFSAIESLRIAGGSVYGSLDNVGRSLRNGRQPQITLCTSIADATVDVEEIMLPASSLPGRILPFSCLMRLVTFSDADAELVQQHLTWANRTFHVEVKPKPKYVRSQIDGPGRRLLALTKELFSAIWRNDPNPQRALVEELVTCSFD